MAPNRVNPAILVTFLVSNRFYAILIDRFVFQKFTNNIITIFKVLKEIRLVQRVVFLSLLFLIVPFIGTSRTLPLIIDRLLREQKGISFIMTNSNSFMPDSLKANPITKFLYSLYKTSSGLYLGVGGT